MMRQVWPRLLEYEKLERIYTLVLHSSTAILCNLATSCSIVQQKNNSPIHSNNMRPSTLFPALLGMATARIVGVAAPSQLAPGEHFNVTLITQNYIQAITDVSAAVGLSTVLFPDTLGTYVGSFHIGPRKHTNLSLRFLGQRS